MRVSKKSEYAVRALVEMTLRAEGREGWRQISQIAASTRIPEKFLEQILLVLKKGGLLKSRRGAIGGYALNVEPDQITLDQIIHLLDGTDTEGRPVESGCAQLFRDVLDRAEAASRVVLRDTTVGELARQVKAELEAQGTVEYYI
jgi:Rrf2 family protein